MYEHRKHRPLPKIQFLRRVVGHCLVALLVLGGALLLGVFGYHHFEGLPWLDALLNASMILGGMGQVDTLQTDGGKIFASCYAIFSGVVFLAIMGIILAPIVHRLLHLFHFNPEK